MLLCLFVVIRLLALVVRLLLCPPTPPPLCSLLPCVWLSRPTDRDFIKYQNLFDGVDDPEVAERLIMSRFLIVRYISVRRVS